MRKVSEVKQKCGTGKGTAEEERNAEAEKTSKGAEGKVPLHSSCNRICWSGKCCS